MAGFDVDQAVERYLALLTPAARARSDAYFDGALVLGAVTTLVSVIACWIIWRSGVCVALRDRLRRGGWRPWVVMWACGAVFIAAFALLTLPWSIYTDFWRERQFGLMNQGFGAWLGDQAIGLVVALLLGPPALCLINAVMRALPRWWWLAGGGLMAGLAALGGLILPVFVLPLFNSYHDLPPGALRTRIEAMARADHIPNAPIVVFDASRQSDRISANVAGFGPTVRIALTDNLVKHAGLAEGVAVVGHEMGHYVLGHVWWLIAMTGAVSMLQFGLLARIGPAVIAMSGRRGGVRALDDPAALPVLFALFALLSLVLSPITTIGTRIAETAADAHGLDLAREPDGFARAAMLISAYRKIDPPAWEEALFYDHPSGHTRVRRAMEWKRDHVPDARIANPAPLPAQKP